MTLSGEVDVVEGRLRTVVARAEREVLASDAAYRHLYDPGVRTRPLFFFGRAATASYFTIGANPSADDFRNGNWSLDAEPVNQALEYFVNGRVVPHEYFRNWEAALSPLGLTYRGGLAHLDVSPRATKSLQVINKLGARVIRDFLRMADADAAYLFAILGIFWPGVRGLFAAGSITKAKYLDEALRAAAPQAGFTFRLQRTFVGRSTNPRARRKVYDVTFGERSVPLFFCPVGPSAGRNNDQEYFRQQVSGNEEYLRFIFLDSTRS